MPVNAGASTLSKEKIPFFTSTKSGGALSVTPAPEDDFSVPENDVVDRPLISISSKEAKMNRDSLFAALKQEAEVESRYGDELKQKMDSWINSRNDLIEMLKNLEEVVGVYSTWTKVFDEDISTRAKVMNLYYRAVYLVHPGRIKPGGKVCLDREFRLVEILAREMLLQALRRAWNSYQVAEET